MSPSSSPGAAAAGDTSEALDGRGTLRHGSHLLLFGAMCGLALAVVAWPELLPVRGRTAWIVGGLTAAGFAAGWLCRGRRPGLGGWVACGGVAAAWAIGLSLALAVEIEGQTSAPARRAAVDALGAAEDRGESLQQEMARTLTAARDQEERLSHAWGRVLPLGLAMPPVALAGILGAVLGRNRRRKRRPDLS